jgi:excisionase family DNA binding protein
MAKTLYRLREVATRTGMSLKTVRRWASERRIPVVKLGRSVLVDERDLDRLIESRRIPARADIAV